MGHMEIFKLITEKVSVKNPKTNNGVTPQELASKYCSLFQTTTENINIPMLIWKRIRPKPHTLITMLFSLMFSMSFMAHMSSMSDVLIMSVLSIMSMGPSI